jgi:pimeloyl-ACP methyl ester carboxylesterase
MWKLRGIEIAYDDIGTGPAVVFLHGYPFDRSMWREQLVFFGAHGYRVVAPDLRGMGQTKAASAVSTMAEMAGDVAALMDKLKIDRAAVCGLSMGGYVTFEFTHLFPSRVRALVFAGARAQGADDIERQSREQQAQRAPADGMNAVADAMLPKLLAPKTLAEKPAIVAHVREMIRRTNPRGAAAAQRGMAARRDHSNDLHEIEAPTLIVAGRDDTVRNPADAEFIHQGIRNSHLEIIEDAGHLMNMEQPEVFNRAMIDFFNSMPT